MSGTAVADVSWPFESRAEMFGVDTSPVNLQWALGYASIEWHVLPIAPGTKLPAGGNGLAHATLDPAIMRGWWRRWPDAGVGISCAASGLVVLDVDPRNGGNESFAKLETTHGPIVSGVMAETGGGGRHIVYSAPSDCRVLGVLAPGVDVKHRGYIVVRPSIHPSGNSYLWQEGCCPLDNDAVPLPAPLWLTERPPRRALSVPRSMGHMEDAESALQYLLADDRDAWLRVGMALHDGFGDAGQALWDRWSATSRKFDATDNLRTWSSFQAGGGVTLASVFAEAERGGWKNPSRRVVTPTAASTRRAAEHLDLLLRALEAGEPVTSADLVAARRSVALFTGAAA